MSPPEAHLENELHENQPLDAVSNEFSELCIGRKTSGRETELETFNSFNFWRVPLPQIGDEGSNVGGEDAAGKENTDDPSDNAENPSNTASEANTENSDQEDKKLSEDSQEEKSSAPGLEFQDLGISDMDIDDCEELESDEKDLTCNESVNDSPKRMAPLSGIPSLRFDDDYLQPYSPNMCFDDDSNRVSSPPRSPSHNQVRVTVNSLI